MNIKKRYKRIISIILVLSMMITNFAGCGNGSNSTAQNQTDISTISDAISNDNSIQEDASTSVLTQEEIDRIDKVSTDIEDRSVGIQNALDCIVADKGDVKEYIDKLRTLLDSSASDVDNWIELQSDLYVSVSDDLSEDAAELLKQRQDEEAEKLRENANIVDKKYSEMKSAYESGDSDKVFDVAEELSGMFNDEISSYGSENANKSVNAKNTGNKNTQSFLRPMVDYLIDDPNEVNEYFEYEFETPIEAYEYIKNNVYTEFYYGRKKTVLGTYESCSGNDYDQAVLLASILNSMGYDTKYVKGNILLTPELALSMTGADNVDIAANIIAMAGIPTTKLLAKDGSIKSLKIEHVWVRAEIPYTDYRGAGNASGDMVWVDLDTSIKFYEKADNIYDYLDNDEVYNGLKKAFDNDGFGKGYDLLKTTTESASQRICDEKKDLYNRRRIIKKETISYLPLSLQYEVKDELEVTESIDVGDSISVYVSGEDLGTYSAAYLSDKSVVIAFDPASQEDVEILSAYGSIFDASANSVYLKPVLYIDGVKVAESEYTEYTLGTQTKIGLSLSYAGNQASKNKYIENNAIAGSIYALTIDSSVVSNNEVFKSYMDLYEKNNTVSESNVFSTEYLGALLSYSGKLYFAQLDAMDIMASETADVADIRCLSEAITGYEVRRKTLYGLTTKLSYGSLFIDVDLDDHAVVSRDGDKNKEILYRYDIGSTGSMCEGLIWSEALHENKEDTVSTISILGKAREQGIEILTLTKDNLNDLSILDNLELDQSEKDRIKTDIESGLVITIPADNVKIGEWSGTGYISLNPNTGIGTYKISGGLSGGFHPYAATGMMIIATIMEFLSAKLLILALGKMTLAGGIIPLMALPAVALLVTGIVVTSMLLCYYVEYMIDQENESFEGFIQWFMLSAFVTGAQLQYVQFMMQVASLYGLWQYNDSFDSENNCNQSNDVSGDNENLSADENLIFGETYEVEDNKDFKAPKVFYDKDGNITNGKYTINSKKMLPHIDNTPKKSHFFSDVDAEKAVLDAAAYADEFNLWETNTGNPNDFACKAKIYIENGPIGVTGSGKYAYYINIYRTATGQVHGCPANK